MFYPQKLKTKQKVIVIINRLFLFFVERLNNIVRIRTDNYQYKIIYFNF